MSFRLHALKVFAALEMKVGETAHVVIADFIRKSAEQGHQFKCLDFLGVIQLGSTKYVRFRTDTTQVAGLVDRRVVIHHGGEYRVLAPEGNPIGRVSSTTMLAPHDPSLHREYRGPGVTHWDRQF